MNEVISEEIHVFYTEDPTAFRCTQIDSYCEWNIKNFYNYQIYDSDAGRWKTLGGPVVIGGDNLPSLVWIGLTDLQNIGGPVVPRPPSSGTTKVGN